MENRSNHRGGERPSLFKTDEQAVALKSINWGRLLGYLKPYIGRMSLALLALLLSTGFGLAFPAIIVRLLDTVTSTTSYGPLNMLALVLLGVFLLQSGFQLHPELPAHLRW